MALQGANVLVVPSCTDDRQGFLRVRYCAQARAIENQAYVLGVNRCGSDLKLHYSGRSQIIGPRGEILADGGEAEGMISATLDLEELEKYRREFPALADMRF